MVGLQRTFSAPDCASPTASPFLDDNRPLDGGCNDYLSAFPAPSQVQPFDLFGLFNTGLGLCVDPQSVFAMPVAAVEHSAAVEYAVAPAPAPATHYGGPVPTPMDLLLGSGGGQVPSSYLSYDLYNPSVCLNPAQQEDLFNAATACINPAELTTPNGHNALLSYPESLFFEDVVAAEGVNEAGLDSEPELVSDDCLVPSPSSTLNTDLPDDAAPNKSNIKSKPKSKKRPSSGGDRQSKSKRRRASTSSRQEDDEEFIVADAGVSESENDDGDYTPVSRSGRPVRGTRRVSSSKAVVVDVSDVEESEEPVPERTCTWCSRTFARIAEKQRHEQAASCRTDAKAVCAVCSSEITGRSDAMRRHQLRTKKCIKIQLTKTPEQLAALGCVSAEEREIDMQRPAAKKQASKKSRS